VPAANWLLQGGLGASSRGSRPRSVAHRCGHSGAQPEPSAAQRLQSRAAWGAAQPGAGQRRQQGHTWGACTWRGAGLAAPFLSERFIAGSSAVKLAYWPCIGAGAGRAAAACQVRGVLALRQASMLLHLAIFQKAVGRLLVTFSAGCLCCALADLPMCLTWLQIWQVRCK